MPCQESEEDIEGTIGPEDDEPSRAAAKNQHELFVGK